MKQLRPLRLLLAGLATSLVALGLAPAGASSANISHSYHSTSSIPNGSIVSLDPSRTDYVQLSNIDNGNRLLGIAVAKDDSLLAVDPADGAVQVATSGNATVLVSTLNGAIGVGDQIAVSPFNGIGMKASSGSRVIGLAQTAFNSSSAGATSQQITDKTGKTAAVQVGYTRVTIGIGTNNTAANGNEKLNGLQKLARSLTGHTVSTPRVIVSLVVATVALIALITLIYASIYGSIISIGRNPLAKYAVFRTLGSVLGMAALTAVIAGLTIFFLLR
jgi:hypothetical protein